jgi:hypothetical protein
MSPITVIVWLLAFYGIYRLAIKVFGEKEVDDEITAAERKAGAEIAAVKKKVVDKFSGIPKDSGA